jgi:hypothetical protein
MAIVDNNVLMRGHRGMIGNVVFRRWGKKTVVSGTQHQKPDMEQSPESKPFTFS